MQVRIPLWSYGALYVAFVSLIGPVAVAALQGSSTQPALSMSLAFGVGGLELLAAMICLGTFASGRPALGYALVLATATALHAMTDAGIRTSNLTSLEPLIVMLSGAAVVYTINADGRHEAHDMRLVRRGRNSLAAGTALFALSMTLGMCADAGVPVTQRVLLAAAFPGVSLVACALAWQAAVRYFVADREPADASDTHPWPPRPAAGRPAPSLP